eukprot:408216-Rhodomonas_salina.1
MSSGSGAQARLSVEGLDVLEEALAELQDALRLKPPPRRPAQPPPHCLLLLRALLLRQNHVAVAVAVAVAAAVGVRGGVGRDKVGDEAGE